jgi:pimeloyl-ACP methyl ester carboxylesterase
MRQIDPKDPDQRLRLVRLYIQSERYNDARTELESVIKDFPALADLKKQVTALYQLSARRLIKEAELRRSAGQDRLAYSMLERFPSEGVAGEVLLQVRDMLDDYKELKQKGQKALELLDLHFAAIADPVTRAEVDPAVAEIKAELNITTFDRLADFVRFADDQSMTSDQKIALAVSGWLLGSGSGITNLAVASSLHGVRELVQEYLTTPHIHRRDEILQELQTMEGSSPRYLAMLISHMKPPVPLPKDDDTQSGFFELTVSGLSEQPEITYFVQLPPEYDPYRRYPCVITLNGAGTTPQQQIDWWAGAYSEQARMRLGQATRQGCIVIAPAWTKPHQRSYEYTAREHAAVLYPLRDACRRFSIDTDKVFLSGHSMGGDAVWDVGLSHPDLWAGVIPIVATADKYVSRYWENGRYVPFYFVTGQMDGDKLARNAMDLDRYLTHHTYDTIIVSYQGRGHEHFLDEIQRIFDWMDLHRRDFFRSEFECVSMRPWDDFFWWAEIQQLPGASIVLPVNWPPDSGVRPGRTDGKILGNRLLLRTAADRATVWLSSEVVDFSKAINVVINGRGRNKIVESQADVLLEDVRTRSDRQHPFSAKVEATTGRG